MGRQKADHLSGIPSGRYFYLFEIPEADEDDTASTEYRNHMIEIDKIYREKYPELKQIYDDGRYMVYANE